MTWRELVVPAVPRGRLALLSAALFARGAAGLQEDHAPGEAPAPRQPWDTGPAPPPSPTVWVRAWFESPDTADVEAILRDLVPASEASWHPVDDTDWSTHWRRGFSRIPVGTFAVAPSWLAEAGDLVIEPGQGFGTGHHATTRAILDHLPALRGTSCLDVGCGSGILALVAHRLGFDTRGIDVDADAIADAKGNAARNGLEVAFDTTPVEQVPGRFDVVLANLYAEVLVALAPAIRARVGDHLLLAGIMTVKVHTVEAAYAGLEEVGRREDGDWTFLHYRHHQ